MSETTAERVAAIRAILGSDDLDAVLMLAREDVPWLLARLDEQAGRVRALEGALRPFAVIDACCDHAKLRRLIDAARRALGAGEGAT